VWTFEIATGRLFDATGTCVWGAYAGYDDGDGVPEPGEGKNDPTKQAERGIGPIPEGLWMFSAPFFHRTAGPYTLRLFPKGGTKTYGRSGFLIHGDSKGRPGAASKGCIVTSRETRMALWESGDHEIMVVSGIARRDIA
jgi:hypothetical protein